MVESVYCTGCSACASVCPVDAISMKADSEGFLYPEIDGKQCVHCGKCHQVCPVNQDQTMQNRSGQAFLAMADDEVIRRDSSSGGAFTLLAERILRAGGMVFGCTMTENCHGAHHVGVESSDDFWQLRGSKYVQSALESTLREAEACLLAGRWVLFSGTPCQIAGVKSYLGNREKLLTVDVICHGAPSPMVWSDYLSALEADYGAKAVRVSFRNKTESWRKYSLECAFDNGAVYRKSVLEDLYLRGFVENLFLRPACHSCVFKGENYRSDLTIGDLWGVERMLPAFRDECGVSLLIPHTEKGVEAVETLENCRVEKVSFDAALISNPSYFSPAKPSPFRDRAIRQIRVRGTRNVLRKYCGNRMIVKVRKKLAKIIRHS